MDNHQLQSREETQAELKTQAAGYYAKRARKVPLVSPAPPATDQHEWHRAAAAAFEVPTIPLPPNPGIDRTMRSSRKLDRFLTREINNMKLSSVADRIRATKERLDKEADALAARLDEIDARAPGAFDRAHAFLDQQKTEVDSIEATLRQLSNIPLDDISSATSSNGSGEAT